MMLSGPNHHATIKKGPPAAERSSSFYRCSLCSRNWVSKNSFDFKNGVTLAAMKLCYSCGAQVFPQERETVKSYQSLIINNCANDSSSAIFVWEYLNGVPVLFDTGAEISVISKRHCNIVNKLSPSSVKNLRGVTGQRINTLGIYRCPLDLGFPITFVHNLVVVDLILPYLILGLDFMKENGIILDPKSQIAYLNTSSNDVQLSTFHELTTQSEIISPCENINSLFKSSSINKIG
ncbi:MAG: hypothetical protein VXY56_12360, partial [Pseudomonadota bacterium]|nr:hypothetical protein [Pseudomonadota bacterium]